MALANYKPIIEYCGGTETGGAYITSTMIQPSSPTVFTTPTAGIDITIRDDKGDKSEKGEVFLIPPSIGLSNFLLNQDHDQVYFKDTPAVAKTDGSVIPLRRHGDHLERLQNGSYRIHGRTDDTMNIGGIKVSSAELERVINSLEVIHEAAAVAIPSPGGGPTRLVLFVVPLSDTTATKEALLSLCQQAVREHLNPLYKIYDIVINKTLPRTASNKIIRRTLRDTYK